MIVGTGAGCQSGITCVHGSRTCTAASLPTLARLPIALPTSPLWLLHGIGLHMPTPLCGPTMTTPPSSPLMPTSPTSILASMMAASRLPPCYLARHLLTALMMMPPLGLASCLTLIVLTLRATHTLTEPPRLS